MALDGDVLALKLCLERIMPPRKDRAVRLALPRIERAEDAREAINVVLGAVGQGRLTLAEGGDALALIETCKGSMLAEEAPPPTPANIRVSFVSPPARLR